MELNTANCCFVCLRSLESSNVNNLRENPYENETTSLKNICKLLRIDTNIPLQHENDSRQTPTDFSVLLCIGCRKVSEKLSNLFMKLEAIHLETDYYVGEMHKRISNSYKDAELVQNYCRRMTSSPDTLKQLLTVDNLRKLFGEKCSCTRFTPFSVKLELLRCPEENDAETIRLLGSGTPIFSQIIKSEGEDWTEQEIEADYEMNLPNTDSVSTEDDPLYEINAPNLKLDTEETNAKDQGSHHMSQSPTSKQSVKSTTNQYKCSACNKILSTKQRLEKHHRNVHLKERINCKMCGMLISPDSFRRHKEICDPIKHQKRLEKQETCKFKCTICNNFFTAKESLNRHIRTVHLNIRKYSCNICNKRFKLSHHLIDHKEQVHLGIKYLCQLCNTRCWSKWALKSHERRCAHNLKT